MLNESILRQFLPFSVLNDALLSEALHLVHVATAKKGTIIFKRGKELADKFFLIEGEVNLINNEFGSTKICAGEESASVALNNLNPTSVSAIAKTPVTYFTINSQDLVHLGRAKVPVTEVDLEEALIEEQSEMEVAELADASDWMSSLLTSPLFNRMSTSQLQELFAKFETVEVNAGEYLVKEGAKGDFFYVLASGTALITDRSGATNVVLHEGQYFGEESLISAAPRNASVVMTSNGVLKRLNAEDFNSLMKSTVLQYLGRDALDGINKPYKLIDVRLPIEYRAEHDPGSINVPLSKLRNTIGELAQSNAYVVSGLGGGRADIAAYLLCQAGFDAFVLKAEQTEPV